jgi:HAD superfamily hydrolase (TIGR01490 family)
VWQLKVADPKLLPYNRPGAQIILEAPKEALMGQVAALFDMDNTLLDTSSGKLYAQASRRSGRMSRRELAQVIWWVFLNRIGLLDMQESLPRMLAASAGNDEREMRRRSHEWFAQDVLPHLTSKGQQRVAEHKEMGHLVAIVSGSTQFAVGPLADHLGIPDRYVSTQLESRDGQLTGRVVPPICLGEGKVVWARRFAAEHNIDLSASYFYTDSVSDLPLLEIVAHPVAVNPDPRLRRVASQRGWPIERFY